MVNSHISVGLKSRPADTSDDSIRHGRNKPRRAVLAGTAHALPLVRLISKASLHGAAIAAALTYTTPVMAAGGAGGPGGAGGGGADSSTGAGANGGDGSASNGGAGGGAGATGGAGGH